MATIKIITEQILRANIELNKTSIDIIDRAFATLATKEVIMPPVLSMDLPMVHGEVDVKTAYIPELETFTIKVSPGFFDNPVLGLPSLNGLMVVFCATTGVVKAVLLDNGYLTDIRTAAAGGVAARYLAPQNCPTLGVIGTGVQAKLQTLAFLQERSVDNLMVWGRDMAKATQFADDLSKVVKLSVNVSDNIEKLVQTAQAVITTTPAQTPLIKPEWLHQGLHITAMGSDSPVKNEIEPTVLTQADKVVVDRLSQSLERGEMRSVANCGLTVADSKLSELGEICAGLKSGRTNDDEITVCDLTGTGIQDTAIADYIYQLSKVSNQDWGVEINT